MNLPKKEKSYTEKEALLKIAAYCTYQERTQQEVRNKLYEYGLKKDSIEEIIVKLLSENFINEERFAKTYAGGKFRIKKWGRKKISEALKQKDISEYCIKKALQEIDSHEYVKILTELLKKQNKKLTDKNIFVRKRKLAQYLMGKGYESELVWDVLNEAIGEELETH